MRAYNGSSRCAGATHVGLGGRSLRRIRIYLSFVRHISATTAPVDILPHPI